MTTLVAAAALVALGAIALYAVLGGADFGGGVWDLLATGPRAQRQRDAISHAIGPVWEANHVWLIFALVALFTCFPSAFADVATGLNTPLTIALVGIVLRGAAFVFRNYAADVRGVARGWTVIFGASSILAPFMFGDAAGALATGRYAWLSPFSFSVGLFAVALCAQVAAVFILHELHDDRAVQDDLRRRAVRGTIALWIVGIVPGLFAAAGEPALFAAMLKPAAAFAIALAMVLGVIVIVLVRLRFDVAARYIVGAEVVAILAGWFGAQAPALVPGRLTLAQAAASDAMIGAFLVAAGAGTVLLVPSLALLFTVFKRAPAPR